MDERPDPHSSPSRAHVIFQGKVQGVFFRASTQRKALSLGVQGWVRNLPNGTVESVMEGSQKRIEALIHWCCHEMSLSRVDYKEVEWEEPTGEFTDFFIR